MSSRFHSFVVKNVDVLMGWAIGCVALVIYLLTMAPTVSFWDCGEFIATSYALEVGHSPGAPFYQLVAHLFTLMAATPQQVAAWSNACSAVCGGVTVALLYWIILLLFDRRTTVTRIAALVGAACYMVCDTAWFSAVESEVYAMAMLMAALIVYCMLRWYADGKQSPRLLVLTALLTGLAVCVHLMCLLTLPAVCLLLVVRDGQTEKSWWSDVVEHFRSSWSHDVAVAMLCIVMFVVGLSPYAIVPILATSGPRINSGDPSTVERFVEYVRREQYEKAPLYPRMWRYDDRSIEYAESWSGGRDDAAGELTYYVSYQLGYMYGRYLLWNFCGRQNRMQGYGGLQNGQFATGIPLLDRMIVGSGKTPPSSMPGGRAVYYLLPLLLGLIGLLNPPARRVRAWVVWLLFLFGGLLLNIYLNHPIYEPRERDYAYVLSFFAFSIWIAYGVAEVVEWVGRHSRRIGVWTAAVALGVPLLMGCQNWDSHDRSEWQTARDVACNILGSCKSGSLLFSVGDNDTFPLWYIQEVEHLYGDVEMYNINLIGYQEFYDKIYEAVAAGREVYFTDYAKSTAEYVLQARSVQVGYVNKMDLNIKLTEENYKTPPVDIEEGYYNLTNNTSWHLPKSEMVDETAERFLQTYWERVQRLAIELMSEGQKERAQTLLVKAVHEVPDSVFTDMGQRAKIIYLLKESGLDSLSKCAALNLQADAIKELDYYKGFSTADRRLLRSRIEQCEVYSTVD